MPVFLAVAIAEAHQLDIKAHVDGVAFDQSMRVDADGTVTNTASADRKRRTTLRTEVTRTALADGTVSYAIRAVLVEGRKEAMLAQPTVLVKAAGPGEFTMANPGEAPMFAVKITP